MSNPNEFDNPQRELEELRQEVRYLRRCAEESTSKALLLDTQSVAIRYELEQKRRGFSLMADLAVTLGQGMDYDSVFVAVSRRVNAALNMQRTAVLVPDADGIFIPAVLQGYSTEEKDLIAERRIVIDAELLDPLHPVLITGADPVTRLSGFREALALPYLISSQVILNNDVVALLVTGRLLEQRSFLPRLGHSDVETVQTVSAYLATMLAGQRLVEAEKRTKIMLDAMPLCCNFWDENYNNVDCNEEAARLFGFANKQEYLDRFAELSPTYQPDGSISAEMVPKRITEAFTSGWVRFEWMHQKPDGEPIPSEITLVRVKRRKGYIVAGYTRDLREQKAMLSEMRKKEDELRLARDLAEKNARAKSEFLANMSHEIRTPMNGILGMIHILSGTGMTDKQRGYVEQAEHSTNLLLRIINDILDFSKIEAGRLEMENIEFSVHKLTRNVYGVVKGQISAKSLKLYIKIKPDVPDLMIGDPLRLEQVLLNLVNNAVKFTQAGEISIRISSEASFYEPVQIVGEMADETAGELPELSGVADKPGKVRLLFEISDTGIGMSEEQVASLFQPFTQADTSTTRKYGGTGLGLAISKSLVGLMNGEIWCESQMGCGSKFSFTATFSLPEESVAHHDQQVQEQSGEQLPEFGSAESGSSLAPGNDGYFTGLNHPEHANVGFEKLQGMHVLLAEDNEINQMIAIELLSVKGVTVDAVANGLEVLEALEKGCYDLVLMDIQMPEMDGLTATGKIRANPRYKDLPIIAMTAHAMVGDREASLDGGMNDHVTKPIDPDLLYAALKRWGRRPA